MKSYKRQLLLALLDLFLLSTAYTWSFWLRLDWEAFLGQLNFILYTLPILLPISLYVHLRMGLFNAILKYASIDTAVAVAKSVIISILISASIFFLVFRMQGMPRSVFVIYAMASILVIGGSRIAVRLSRNTFNTSPKDTKKIALYGAGDYADLVLRNLRASSNSRHEPVALIDDDPAKHMAQIHGVRVLGGMGSLAVLAKTHTECELWVCDPEIPSDRFRELFKTASSENIAVKILAATPSGLSSQSMPRFHDPDVKDLLRRPPRKLNREQMSEWIAGRRVLITGAGGSIGAELSRQISALRPASLCVLDNSEYNLFRISRELEGATPHLVDVRDREAVERVFELETPDIVIHAAAYKHVPLVETNPVPGIQVNVGGLITVAEAALSASARDFLLVSTDKAVRPTNIMGATKRLGEEIIQHLNQEGPTKFTAVRFGNVLGSSGSVIPLFQEQIRSGGPVTVTHQEMTRYFMLIPEAVELVIQAGSISKGGEIFILDMGEPVNIYELAQDMIRLMGRTTSEIPITIVGSRPGEKLHEELFLTEQDYQTQFPDIFIDHEKASLSKWKDYRLSVNALLQSLDSRDPGKGILMLKELVPSFDPSFQLTRLHIEKPAVK